MDVKLAKHENRTNRRNLNLHSKNVGKMTELNSGKVRWQEHEIEIQNILSDTVKTHLQNLKTTIILHQAIAFLEIDSFHANFIKSSFGSRRVV